MRMGPAKNDPERQVGVFNMEVVATLPAGNGGTSRSTLSAGNGCTSCAKVRTEL